MGRLDEQRDTLLRGELPELDMQYEVYEAAGRIGLVRLLPITPLGDLLAPEAGKIDLNHVDADGLARTGMIEEELSEAIIAYRDQTLGRPFQSVTELLDVEGVTPEMIYGPLDELTVMDEMTGGTGGNGREGDPGRRMAMLFAQPTPRGLADLLTVYGYEPVLQQSGDYCIPLAIAWTDDLTSRFEERFGDLVEDVRAIITSENVSDESDVVRLLRERAVPVERWPELLDSLSPEPGEYRFGRLDINTASYEALLTLTEPDIARQIVNAREDLSREERATIVWPLTRGIIDEEAFETMAPKITTRCYTYRLWIAAGEVDADDEDGPLKHPLICEIVIDLAASTPRVAYLRDVTMLQIAALLAADLSPDLSPEAPLRRDDPEEAGDEPADPGQSGNTPTSDIPAESDFFPDDSLGTESDNEQRQALPGGAVPEQPANESGTKGSDSSRSQRIGRWKNGNASESS
ncbi:MAG: helix-hairpin-helix domain-containing protein [Planctomycetes bacterium]|nr:helix-hairpin-helix domain-containing protein [Planctomycetota bacterium]